MPLQTCYHVHCLHYIQTKHVCNCHMIYVPLIEYTSPLEVQTVDLHNTGNKD